MNKLKQIEETGMLSLKNKKKVFLIRENKVRELINIGISYKDAMEIVVREASLEEDKYIGKVFLPALRNALKFATMRGI